MQQDRIRADDSKQLSIRLLQHCVLTENTIVVAGGGAMLQLTPLLFGGKQKIQLQKNRRA